MGDKHIKYNQALKTLGPVSAHLVMTLYDRRRSIFHFFEAEEILGGRARATKIIFQLVKSGVVTRLKSGTYRLVPFELGFEREYLGNPYVAMRELIVGKHKGATEAYYLSHGSAFDLHQMATQPQFIVYASSPN